ncbi:Putative Mce family protein [Hoyosella subflava DQS3-9A1]|uniref:Putative Mce family protein n=1 Tax=Hoyosella subflava (strain DSM 45089 / JCM 17490 / NBRC 109087 / DQS3-9A1) TaxID=443218 RepID=F6ERP3_HOYSD|nr:Putative Mce family protein [Hoyosella subflava DQS3-9A1]
MLVLSFFAASVALNSVRTDDRIQILVQTEHIGDGIAPGTHVRLKGVQIGAIEEISSAGDGTQVITMRLDEAQLFGLTNTLDVNYAPSNLFGISEVELTARPGGIPLQDAELIDLTGTHAGRVQDATMGSLIRAVTVTATEVLTPEFADTLQMVAVSLDAFGPLIEIIVMTGEALDATQIYPASFLMAEYGSALQGAAPMLTGSIQLVDTFKNLEILQTHRELFDEVMVITINDLFPGVADLLFTAEEYTAELVAVLPPLLDSAARMVPTPQRSSEELREILDRLDRSFSDTPDGPAVDVSVALSGVPALSVPLFGGLPLTTESVR